MYFTLGWTSFKWRGGPGWDETVRPATRPPDQIKRAIKAYWPWGIYNWKTEAKAKYGSAQRPNLGGRSAIKGEPSGLRNLIRFPGIKQPLPRLSCHNLPSVIFSIRVTCLLYLVRLRICLSVMVNPSFLRSHPCDLWPLSRLTPTPTPPPPLEPLMPWNRCFQFEFDFFCSVCLRAEGMRMKLNDKPEWTKFLEIKTK